MFVATIQWLVHDTGGIEMAAQDKDNAAKTREVRESIDKLVEGALQALDRFAAYDQKQVDDIVRAMALAGVDHHMALAKQAVEETGRGVFEDKITKNLFATEYIYHSIKYEKTVGIIEDNDQEGYVELAEPVGVVCAVTPTTNPTSTTMFKALIAIKTRNPIVFAFHPSAQGCSAAAAQVMLDAAIAAGAPENCIQWITEPSIEATQYLMNHEGVATVLATGGAGMVRAAYSTGKPALGVGPGNVPCYIEKTADVRRAATDLILSKTFDNGMICASEQSVIVDRAIAREFEAFMGENNCLFLNEEQTAKLTAAIIVEGKGTINPAIVGHSAGDIARQAGIDAPEGVKILIAKQTGVGDEYPLSQEKLSPVLAYYIVDGPEEGIARAEQVVAYGGLGHTAVIHSNDQAVIDAYAGRLKASRLVVNSPSSHGAIGDIYNAILPSLTLGCGSYGRNSTSSNVTTVNLINKKRVAKRKVNMQWFKIPEKIFFENGSTQYLEKMPDISRAFIVTDPFMAKTGYVDRVLYHLRKRQDYVHCEIFADVEPDPSVETIQRGCALMEKFQPDVIIALGGGSAIDAAKGMWLFYEYPDTDFDALRLRFLDIRKRVFKFPKLGNKAKMVAIPTTSGTGSEVTSFAVITDRARGVKYPLADYELTPDVAIIDPQYVQTVPPAITADTGMDVLTHAIEAYVSIMASDYTDGLAIKAIQLVFEYLPRAFHNGDDALAREKMHNASTIAGMAFTNAFLGINHSLAHKLGGEFHIPHGRANAILLPYVVAYNAQKPTKFVAFPKYGEFVADRKYAEIARALGLQASTTEQGVRSLVEAIRGLMTELNMPATIAACGVEEAAFLAVLPELSEKAFEDQCTTANPRLPLVTELAGIYRRAYGLED